MKEAEDSSLVDHISTVLLGKFLIPVQVLRGRRFLPMHTYSSMSFSTILCGSNNQDYSCTYPLGIEHVGMVEKGTDSERERDQGQPKAIASPEKIEKEVKKTRGIIHPKMFEARAQDGHHRDYILLLYIGLAHKSTLVYFLFLFFFFFLSDSRIVSHLPFSCKWQNRFWDSEPVVTHFLSNKGETSDIRIPRSFSELHPAPCMHDVCHACGLGSSRTSK